MYTYPTQDNSGKLMLIFLALCVLFGIIVHATPGGPREEDDEEDADTGGYYIDTDDDGTPRRTYIPQGRTLSNPKTSPLPKNGASKPSAPKTAPASNKSSTSSGSRSTSSSGRK